MQFLELFAKPGDLIIDLFCGSASTLIACEELGFEYIGFELNEKYFNDASKRIYEWRKQGKLFKPPHKITIQEELKLNEILP